MAYLNRLLFLASVAPCGVTSILLGARKGLPDTGPAIPGNVYSNLKKTLHFLHIAKNGGMTIVGAINERRPGCGNINYYDHCTVAEVLTRTSPELVSFVILRDPCERFASIYFYMKKRYQREKIEGLDFEKYTNPAEFGKALLQHEKLHDMFTWNGEIEGEGLHAKAVSVGHDGSPLKLGHRLAWKASYYINNMTEIACLPTIEADVDRIWKKHVPHCKANWKYRNPTHDAEEEEWKNNKDWCSVTEDLYPEDWSLWRQYCAPREGIEKRSDGRNS